jgi:hypothetical protein
MLCRDRLQYRAAGLQELNLQSASQAHDAENQQSFIQKAFSTADYWTGPRAAIRQIDGTGQVSTLAFFGRDGTQLPVLE